MSDSDWVLTIIDVTLTPPTSSPLAFHLKRQDPRIGTVCGKLLTMSAGFDFPEKPVVDSTGIYFTHLFVIWILRGSLEYDSSPTTASTSMYWCHRRRPRYATAAENDRRYFARRRIL